MLMLIVLRRKVKEGVLFEVWGSGQQFSDCGGHQNHGELGENTAGPTLHRGARVPALCPGTLRDSDAHSPTPSQPNPAQQEESTVHELGCHRTSHFYITFQMLLLSAGNGDQAPSGAVLVSRHWGWGSDL